MSHFICDLKIIYNKINELYSILRKKLKIEGAFGYHIEKGAIDSVALFIIIPPKRQ